MGGLVDLGLGFLPAFLAGRAAYCRLARIEGNLAKRSPALWPIHEPGCGHKHRLELDQQHLEAQRA